MGQLESLRKLDIAQSARMNKKKKKKKKGKKRRRRKKIFSELIFYCLGCHPMGIPMDFEH
jgi:hypothetical protein